MKRRFWAALGICGALFWSPASAQTFNQFIGFGDSTIDSGWYVNAPSGGGPVFDTRLQAAVAAGGRGSPVGVGLMNSEVLAAFFGLSAIPANQSGGTNYAVSGARSAMTNPPGIGLFTGAVPVTTQISNYLAGNGGVANPNALYLISAGGNDSNFAVNNISSTVTQAATDYLTAQADALAASITNLWKSGAQYIVIPNHYLLDPNSQGRFGVIFIERLWSDLSRAGVNFIPADIRTVRQVIHSNPGAFGLTTDAIGTTGANTASACQTPPGVVSAWGLICTPSTTPNAVTATLTSSNSPQTSLFSDDQHFSAAGHKIEADYIYSLIVAPSQISFLAEHPLQTRRQITIGIQEQIDLALRQAGQGYNVWINGDVSRVKIDNSYNGFPDDPSTPVSATMGLNYRAGNGWLVGAAVTLGRQKPKFSLGGGFTDDEAAISLYAGYRSGPFWGDVIASYGWLRYDVNRIVPIGITSQSTNATTHGSNVSLAAEAGYEFVNGPVSHGPVVGLVLQKVRVDGFTEAGSFTALAFEDQTRDSAVTALGYRARLDYGIWWPFAQIVWNHELASLDRSVTASLTTISAPSYFMPAVRLGRDWATATVGTELKAWAGWTGLASFTAQLGQTGTKNYGGRLGLNYAFNWQQPIIVKAKY